MSYFTGTLKGSAPTTVSRAGSPTSGVVANLSAASGGYAQVTLYSKAGVDSVMIELINKAGDNALLYDGPIDFVPAQNDAPWLTAS
jgi:hypothetical protein